MKVAVSTQVSHADAVPALLVSAVADANAQRASRHIAVHRASFGRSRPLPELGSCLSSDHVGRAGPLYLHNGSRAPSPAPNSSLLFFVFVLVMSLAGMFALFRYGHADGLLQPGHQVAELRPRQRAGLLQGRGDE